MQTEKFLRKRIQTVLKERKLYEDAYTEFRANVTYEGLTINYGANKLIKFDEDELFKMAKEIKIRVIFSDVNGIQFMGPSYITLKDLSCKNLVNMLDLGNVDLQGNFVIMYTKMVRLNDSVIERLVTRFFNHWFSGVIDGQVCECHFMLELYVIEVSKYKALLPQFIDRSSLEKKLKSDPYMYKSGKNKSNVNMYS